MDSNIIATLFWPDNDIRELSVLSDDGTTGAVFSVESTPVNATNFCSCLLPPELARRSRRREDSGPGLLTLFGHYGEI